MAAARNSPRLRRRPGNGDRHRDWRRLAHDPGPMVRARLSGCESGRRARPARPPPILVLASGAALATVIGTGIGAAWRTILALWFVLVCPGVSLVGVLGLRDRLRS